MANPLHQANFRYTLEPDFFICDEVSDFFKECISCIPAIWLKEEENPEDDMDYKAFGTLHFTVIRDTCSAIASKRIKASGLSHDMSEFLFCTTDDDKEYLKRVIVHLRNRTRYVHEEIQHTFDWVVNEEPPPFYKISVNFIEYLISDVRRMGKNDGVEADPRPNLSICDEISRFFNELASIIATNWSEGAEGLSDADVQRFTILQRVSSDIGSKRLSAIPTYDNMGEFFFNTTDDDKEHLRRATVHIKNKTSNIREQVDRVLYLVVKGYQVTAVIEEFVRRLIPIVRSAPPEAAKADQRSE